MNARWIFNDEILGDNKSTYVEVLYIINLVSYNVISSIWVKVQTPLRIADVALKRSLVA